MSKLIELGVVSQDTRQTSPGISPDGVYIPAGSGLCWRMKILHPQGTPPDLVVCPV